MKFILHNILSPVLTLLLLTGFAASTLALEISARKYYRARLWRGQRRAPVLQ